MSIEEEYKKWRVVCQTSPGSKKNKQDVIYVRAKTRERAEIVGRRETGMRHARAYEYKPWLDPAFVNYVRAMPECEKTPEASRESFVSGNRRIS